MNNLRLVLALALAVIWLLVLLPFHLVALVALKFGLRFPAGRIPVLFHKGLLLLFGVRCHISHSLPKDRPLLLVSNHVSWLDIVVLGSIAPLRLDAKSDMKSWPIFGQLAQLQRTVFVERGHRRGSAIQASEIAERMVLNEVMVLFPEGTTTDHNRIEPFKTSLFEAAKLALKESEVDHATVQPVAIHYTHLHGLPLSRAERPHVSWPGEIGLGESILPLVRTGALDVHVKLGAPVLFDANTHSKSVAAATRGTIEAMLDPSQGGRTALRHAEIDLCDAHAKRPKTISRQARRQKGLHQDLWLPDERLRFHAYERRAGSRWLCAHRHDGRRRSGAAEHMPHPREGG